MSKTRFFVPDFKKADLGYTRIPTCVAENPKKWGLGKNETLLYLYLASRVKKDQFFNGKSLRWQLQGTMGQSAVSMALTKLCVSGFCRKKVHYNKRRQIAGWDYQFFFLPIDREIVAAVDQDICGQLEASGWFDSIPDDGFPPHGNSSGKERKQIEERSDKEKTPLPLSEKEEKELSSFPGKTEPQDSTRDEHPGDQDSTSSNSPGKYRSRLSANKVGKRLLGALHPTQIPTDYALRSLARRVDNGQISDAYLTFLEDNLLRPNRERFDAGGTPLMTVGEIGAFIDDEESSPKSPTFRSWKQTTVRNLNDEWQRMHPANVALQELEAELQQVTAVPGPICEGQQIDYPGSGYAPSSPPYCYAVCLTQASKRQSEHKIDEIVHSLSDDKIWRFLLSEAGLNHKEYHSLRKVVSALADQLPPSYSAAIEALRTNWVEQWKSRKEALVTRFANIGAKVPDQTKSNQ